MSWNNKVIWTEGMFLQPLHFQQQDRNVQNWVESRCSGLQSYSWGITHLEIDQQLLALGKVAINVCRGVFPDGTPFNIPDQHTAPEPLDILSETKNEVIYLALPVQRALGKEITWDNEDNELSRYRQQEIEIKDIHSQAESGNTTIQSGELWVRLRASSLAQDAYVTIPVARVVEQKTDKQVVLDHQFIPSCLHSSASEQLVLELGHTESIKSILLNHQCLTCISKIAVKNEISNGKLIRVPLKNFECKRDFLMIYHKDKYHSELFEKFIGFTKTMIKQMLKEQ